MSLAVRNEFHESNEGRGREEGDTFVLSGMLKSHLKDCESSCSPSVCPNSDTLSSGPCLSSSQTSPLSSFGLKSWEAIYLRGPATIKFPVVYDDVTDERLLVLSKEDGQENRTRKFGSVDFADSAIAIVEFSSSHQRSESLSQFCKRAQGGQDPHIKLPKTRANGFAVVESLPVLQIFQTGTTSVTKQAVAFLENPVTTQPMTENRENLDIPKQLVASHLAFGEEKGNENPVPIEGQPRCGIVMEEPIPFGVKTVSFAQLSAETPLEFYSSPVTPLRTAGAVPFKWEEVPGKPKPWTDLSPCKLLPLQLPPRLLYRTDSSTDSPLTPCAKCQSAKLNAVPSPSWSCSTPQTPEIVHNSSHKKSFWQRAAFCRKAEDAPSVSSTLIGSEAGKQRLSSFSSSESSDSVLDLPCLCSPPSSDFQSCSSDGQNGHLDALTEDEFNVDEPDPRSLFEDDNTTSLLFGCFGPAVMEVGKSYLRRSTITEGRLLRLLEMSRKWRQVIPCRKRRFQETELWAPTLATYYLGIERKEISSVSGQLQSLDRGSRRVLPQDGTELLVGGGVYEPLTGSSISNYESLETEAMPDASREVKKTRRLGDTGYRCCYFGHQMKVHAGTIANQMKWVIRKLRTGTDFLASRETARGFVRCECCSTIRELMTVNGGRLRKQVNWAVRKLRESRVLVSKHLKDLSSKSQTVIRLAS